MISKTRLLAAAAVLPLLALASDASADTVTGTPALVSVEVVLMPVITGANVPKLGCGELALVAVPVNASLETYYSENMVQSASGPGVCIINRMRVPTNETRFNGQPTAPAYIKLVAPHSNAACPTGYALKFLGDQTLGPISLGGAAKVGNMGAFVVQSWSCNQAGPVTK
jgi:hypothetical protein